MLFKLVLWISALPSLMPLSPMVLIASDDAFELATLGAALRLQVIKVVSEARTTEIAANLDSFSKAFEIDTEEDQQIV